MKRIWMKKLKRKMKENMKNIWIKKKKKEIDING